MQEEEDPKEIYEGPYYPKEIDKRQSYYPKEREYKPPPSKLLFPYEMEEIILQEIARQEEEEAQQRILFPHLFEGEEEKKKEEPVYAKPTLTELRRRETGQLLRPLSRTLEASTAQRLYDQRVQRAREMSLRANPSPQNTSRPSPGRRGWAYLPYQPRLYQSRNSAFDTPQEQQRDARILRLAQNEADIARQIEEKRQAEKEKRQAEDEKRQAETGCVASGRPNRGRIF
jgi:hypothetical protein